MQFRFDQYLIDVNRRELSTLTGVVPLEPLAFDLLIHLVRNRDRVVSKDELVAEVWSGRIVTDSALVSCVAAVRRAIGDTGGSQRFIRTVTRKGFRFIGDVLNDAVETSNHEPSSASVDVVRPDMAAELLPAQPSIAVLPFTGAVADGEHEFFLDGIVDDLITALSQDRSLFVIARSSSFTYKGRPVDAKQVAADLGVKYILEGSARRAGDSIRVNVRLLDAALSGHIWAERYDCPVDSIFAVEDDITKSVVQAIVPAVANAERQRAMRRSPASLSAWEAWQRALWHWSGGDLPNSRQFLQQAIALDPRFAAPRALLAWLYLSESTLGVGPPLHKSIALAQVEAQTAIELDPDSGFGHAMLAWVLDHRTDTVSALEEADTAIALSPNDPQGYIIKGKTLVYSGRPVEAHEPLETALRLDPRGPVAAVALHIRTVGSYFERDFATAEMTARRAIRTWPQYGRPFGWLPAILGQMGRPAEAAEALKEALTVASSYLQYLTSHTPPYFRQADHDFFIEGLRKAGWRD